MWRILGIVGGTIAVWKWVLKPAHRWTQTTSFRGLRVMPKKRPGPVFDEVGTGMRDPWT